MTTETSSSTPIQRKVVWGAKNGNLDLDIRCAALSRAGVMITGPAERAEALAMEIHRRSQPPSIPAQVVDGGDDEGLLRALESPEQAEDRPLLVRNVDRLSLPLQARLLARMARGWRRIICWSKEPPDHRLVPELLYRLNVVRIDLWVNE